MNRLTAIAMVLALSFSAHAEKLFEESILQVSMQSLSMQAFGAPGWNVGDSADYNVDMGFMKGKMHNFVREETERGYWMEQNMDLGSMGKQKIEVLLDKGTFRVIELRINGQQQDPPKQNLEVIESREEKVTVPAGTFETMFVKAKDGDNGKITQAWINPEIVPMSGMVKTISPGPIGEAKVELTAFHRKETDLSALNASLRDPLGETATYILDNDSARTTSMIRSGTAVAEVTEYVPNSPDGPAYKTKLTYDLNIDWVGRKSGTNEMSLPEEYFKPEFMQRLRREGEIVMPKFTVTHQGYADARTPGKVYRNCDKVLIHNIDTSVAGFDFLAEAFSGVAQAVGATYADVEDLKILAHINEGTPVLGAVKIDISGKASGFGFKAGFDIQER